MSVRDGELHLNPALPEQWQQLSFPLFWQGCELQVTRRAAQQIRTSAPVSLRLNGQLISVAEESVFCLGILFCPSMGPLPRIRRVNETARVIFDLDGVITDSAHLHFGWRRLPLKLASALMRSLTNP